MLNSDTWNSLNECLNWIIGITKQYLEPFDWLFIWVLWHINLFRLFNAKSFYTKNSSILNFCIWYILSKTFLFQAIEFSQTVLFQTIQFSISTQFKCQNSSTLNNSVWHKYTVQFYLPIDRTLSSATTLSQSRPGSNGNKGGIPHSLKLQHYWNLTIRLFSVISRTLVGGGLPLCREVVVIY